MHLHPIVMNLRWTAAALAATLLSACGGGSYEAAVPETPPGTVPASATVSPRAYTLFAGSLAASDSAEPLTLPEGEAPVTETDDPLPLN